MKRVRQLIDKMLTRRGCCGTGVPEWENIEAAIRKAQPTSVGDIYAALDKLAKARGESGAAITLFNNRMGVVEVCRDKYPFHGGDELATIREVTPPPEPTLRENLHTIELSLCEDVTDWADRRAAAREALARVYKQIPKP